MLNLAKQRQRGYMLPLFKEIGKIKILWTLLMESGIQVKGNSFLHKNPVNACRLETLQIFPATGASHFTGWS